MNDAKEADVLEHLSYMDLALAEAEKAFAKDEVPVGAIIIHNGLVIGRGFNQREYLQSPVAHAEIIAIAEASKRLGTWRLLDAVLYVTMEPCAICAGALVLARIKTVIFAIPDPKGGACGTVFDIVREPRLNHSLEVIGGIREEESRALIQKFFREKRKRQKEKKKSDKVI